MAVITWDLGISDHNHLLVRGDKKQASIFLVAGLGQKLLLYVDDTQVAKKYRVGHNIGYTLLKNDHLEILSQFLE